MQVGGINILTDPVFFDYVGLNRMLSQRRVTNAGVKIESLPHIDVILISHNHYDHLDLPSLRGLVTRQKKRPATYLDRTRRQDAATATRPEKCLGT